MAIDVSQLQVSLAEGDGWQRTLSITVPSELVRQERRAAVRQISSRVQLPGFRAGKVPPAVVEKRFGAAIEQELLDRVIQEAYKGVLAEQELRPISEGSVGEIQYQPEADLTFSVSFEVAPVLEFTQLEGFRVERPVVRISDEDVQQVLDRIREQEGSWVTVEEGTPGARDRVTIRIQRLEAEGEEPRPYEFTLGEGEAIADVEAAIRTLTVGGSEEFTITFPDDLPHEERRGKQERLRIFLDGRKELELPPLDDALAKTAGAFETLEQLKDRIREDLQRQAESEVGAVVRGGIMEQLLAANPFDVPNAMVDHYIRSVVGGSRELSDEELTAARSELGERATYAVKRHLVVSRIAEAEGLQATPEEVDLRIEELAERNGVSPADLYTRLQKSGQIDQLEVEITEGKVFDLLISRSEITEKG